MDVFGISILIRDALTAACQNPGKSIGFQNSSETGSGMPQPSNN